MLEAPTVSLSRGDVINDTEIRFGFFIHFRNKIYNSVCTNRNGDIYAFLMSNSLEIASFYKYFVNHSKTFRIVKEFLQLIKIIIPTAWWPKHTLFITRPSVTDFSEKAVI